MQITGGTVTFTSDITLENADILLMYEGSSAANLTIAGPLVNSMIGFFSEQDLPVTVTLSGPNSSNTQNIIWSDDSAAQASTLNITSAIGDNSTLELQGGVLHVSTDQNFTNTTFGQGIVLLDSSTITTDGGSTLNISLLQMPGEFYEGTLILNGPGTNTIQAFEFDFFNQSLTVDGVLGGSSGLTVTNPEGDESTLALNSVNTYTGPTIVGDSESAYLTLQINSGAQIGSFSEPITIYPNNTLTNNGTIHVSTITNNGTLNGSGTIDGTTVDNYGTIRAGNSPGTLTVNGDLVSNPGSTVQVFITPSENSLLDVLDSITLGSDVTLDIQPATGCYERLTNFTILTSGTGLTGTFSAIDLNSILITPAVFYGPDSVTLSIKRENLRDLLAEGNGREIATAVDTLIDSGHSLCGIIGEFILSPLEVIENALDQLQPALFTALAVTQENNAVKVQNTLNYRLNTELDTVHCFPIHSKESETKTSTCDREKRAFQIWISGMGDALNQKNTGFASNNYVGYHESTGGGVLGIDYRFADCLYAGVLGAYTDSDIKWNSSRGKGHIQSAYTGLYLSGLGKMFYGNISVLGAWSHYKADRNIDLLIGDFTASNKHGGAQLLAHADTGINLGWNGFTIRPFDSFDYVTQTENAYTETGADVLDLSIQKNNSILLRNELGLNFAYCLCVKGSRWTVSPKISWVREVRTKGAQITSEFVDTDTPFTVTGFFPNRSLVSPGVSITGTTLNDRLTLELYYDGEFDGNYSDHSYGGQVRVSF